MDRNQITGLALIFLIITVYFYFTTPPESESELGDNLQDSTQVDDIKEQKKENSRIENTTKISEKDYGDFFALTKGKEKDIVLENKDLKVTLSTKGGKPKSVELKNYKTYHQKPLILIDDKNSVMNFKIDLKNGKEIDIYQLFAQTTNKNVNVKKGKKGTIIFRTKLSPKSYIEQTYSLKDEGFQLGYDVKFVGMKDKLKQKSTAQFAWYDELKLLEKDYYLSRSNSTVNYYTAEGGYNYLNYYNTGRQEDQITEKVHWVSFKQKFFTSAIIAKNENFKNADIASLHNPQDSSNVKVMEAYIGISNKELLANKGNFEFYFGPNQFDLLNGITEGFKYNVYIGWSFIGGISRFIIIPLFTFLEGLIGSYGIILIVTVFIIKLALSPLTYKSYKSMAKMKALKPQLDELKAKHEGDNTAMQQAQMKLYQQVGINPLSGCIPMLLQMPILLAMFSFFPNAIELRQESFLWALDLSTYDSVLDLPFTLPSYGSHVSLFALLMTASTILLTLFSSQNQTMQGPLKYMPYMMPVILLFVLNSYPAGLNFYYLVSNLVTFGQQYFIKRYFIDEQALQKTLEQNKLKNKNKKKSKWLERLEDAQKKAQEKQQAQMQARKEQKKAERKKKK